MALRRTNNSIMIVATCARISLPTLLCTRFAFSAVKEHQTSSLKQTILLLNKISPPPNEICLSVCLTILTQAEATIIVLLLDTKHGPLTLWRHRYRDPHSDHVSLIAIDSNDNALAASTIDANALLNRCSTSRTIPHALFLMKLVAFDAHHLVSTR